MKIRGFATWRTFILCLLSRNSPAGGVPQELTGAVWFRLRRKFFLLSVKTAGENSFSVKERVDGARESGSSRARGRVEDFHGLQRLRVSVG